MIGTPDWIAVDWGTSHLRAFAMQGSHATAEVSSDNGMGKLARDAFEAALLDLISPWLSAPVDIVACGMVGSRQGWHEAPYRAVPCSPLDPTALVRVPTQDPRLHVTIVPGLKQINPADVMRGEETQIAGALALLPGFDGVLCLPGTHAKWVHVSAGEVVSFQTCMTGELFALLSQHSVLRHGMAGDGWDIAAFDTALSDALSRPERLGARLFSLRAEGLLNNLSHSESRARLSGLLIGVEMAATKAYWLGQPVAVVGADRLAALYARALTAQGAAPRLLSVRDATLAGLAFARRTAPRTVASGAAR